MRLTPWLVSTIAIVIALFSINSCHQKEQDRVAFEYNLKISKDSVHHYKLRNGILVGRVQSMQLTVQGLKTQSDQLGIDKKDLQKQVGSLQNLVSYYKGQIQITQMLNSVVHDTVEVEKSGTVLYLKKFHFSNDYLHLDEVYNPANDSIHVKYLYNTEFTITTYYKKASIFSFNKKLVADFTLKDPNASLSGGQSVIIIPPKKKFYETTLFKIGVGVMFGKLILK